MAVQPPPPLPPPTNATAGQSTSALGSGSMASDAPREMLLRNISTTRSLLSDLFTQLPSSTSTVGEPKGIAGTYNKLQDLSAELLSNKEGIRSHQAIWARVERKKNHVRGLERRVRDLLRLLEGGRRELEGLVRGGEEVMRGIEKSREEPLAIPTILAHAHSLAKHSSAPISSLLTPLDKAQYMPWPTEGAMRMGLLFQLSGGGMGGVGQVGSMGDTQSEDVVMDEPTVNGIEIHREDHGRVYDPGAVYNLELNSDSEDD